MFEDYVIECNECHIVWTVPGYVDEDDLIAEELCPKCHDRDWTLKL